MIFDCITVLPLPLWQEQNEKETFEKKKIISPFSVNMNHIKD